jgi:hypothetical protein
MKIPAFLAVVCCVSAASLRADDVSVMPAMSIHLEAARYDPTYVDLHEVGWVGAGAALVGVHDTTLWMTGDLETTLGNTRRAFDATQINYHLEPSVRHAFGVYQGELFFHHVSRHVSDREKPNAIDWNILGLRARAPLGPVYVEASVGHVTQESRVGYRFEAVAQVDGDVVKLGTRNALYGLGYGRYVSAESSEEFPRGSFLDARLEGGIRFRNEKRRLEAYAAWERRNDVLVLEGGQHDRALFGVRMLQEPWRP